MSILKKYEAFTAGELEQRQKEYEAWAEEISKELIRIGLENALVINLADGTWSREQNKDENKK